MPPSPLHILPTSSFVKAPPAALQESQEGKHWDLHSSKQCKHYAAVQFVMREEERVKAPPEALQSPRKESTGTCTPTKMQYRMVQILCMCVMVVVVVVVVGAEGRGGEGRGRGGSL